MDPHSWNPGYSEVNCVFSQRLGFQYAEGQFELYADFQLCGGLAPLTPTLFKGQL